MEPKMAADGLRVMVLVPHQDDETLGAGATIAKLVDRGATVHVRAATAGQRGVGGETMEEKATTRTAELRAACEVLGVHSVASWGFMDCDLYDTPELRDAIVGSVQEVGANLLITTPPWDYHTDHRTLGSTVLNCQHRYTSQSAPALVYMDLFMRGVGIDTVMPDIWLDATEHWSRKADAYACHASQGGHLAEYMRAIATLRGQERKPRVKYAECFYGPRTAGHDEGLRKLILALES